VKPSIRQPETPSEGAVERTCAKKAFNRAAKKEVMGCVGMLVEIGFARQTELGNGETELALLSGEIFRLRASSMTRIA